jgi:hypothetical protein
LSWRIDEGYGPEVELGGFAVVLAGFYFDDEARSPWRVVLYVDEQAGPVQRRWLADIFLGRAGGTTLRNFAAAIGELGRSRAPLVVSAKTMREGVSSHPPSSALPSSSSPRFARIVFANRENTARASGGLNPAGKAPPGQNR